MAVALAPDTEKIPVLGIGLTPIREEFPMSQVTFAY
jgi:hypothetical protein